MGGVCAELLLQPLYSTLLYSTLLYSSHVLTHAPACDEARLSTPRPVQLTRACVHRHMHMHGECSATCIVE